MMHSRSMGGGRRLALLGAILILVGCLLPWYAVGGGEGELSRVVIMAFQRPEGLATILAALATLALIALPFAMHPRPVALDRGLPFGILAVVVIVAMILFVVEVLPMPQGLLPTGAYGFWISAVGAIMLARAAFDISREPPRR
jgi:hypothetical protein